MAAEHASELASIVAAYLLNHGFAKTLAAFLRENGDTVQEAHIVDLETLYKLHISTQANGASKTKKLRKAKPEDGPEIAKGDADIKDDLEDKALANLRVNGGTSSDKKKKKKGEKENVAVDSSIVPRVDQTGGEKEAKMTPKEEKDSKNKRRDEKLEEDNVKIVRNSKNEKCLPGMTGTPSVKEALSNGHAAACDKALRKNVVESYDRDGGGLATEQQVAHPETSLNKISKKEKKGKGGEQSSEKRALVLRETRPVDYSPVLLLEDGTSKKKRKKSKESGGFNICKEETKDDIVAKPVSQVPSNVQTEKVDATIQPVELPCELEGCETSSKNKKRKKELSSQATGDVNGILQELSDAKLEATKNDEEIVETSSKKKKRRKELSSQATGDVNGSLQEPSDAKLEATKNDEEIVDSRKESGKKRKSKEDSSQSTLAYVISKQKYDNSNTCPEQAKESGEGEGVDGENAEMHESGSAKAKKQKETPNSKLTPTGALAFKRVEIEKVSFSDPRLGDNSYWAKDGAEEGYGAKAQEVLGLVRGRDFRHEKTKKKRGSYRGGLIGLQSHSIKFENSDED